MGVTRSSLCVLAKAKSLVVAEPMIPLVDEWLVDLLEERQASVVPASYVPLGYRVSPSRDAHRHTSHGEVLRRQLDEVEGHAVARCLPGPHPTRVHRRGQRGLDGEASAAPFRIGEPTEHLTTSRNGMREGRAFGLNLVHIQKLEARIQRRQQFPRERGLSCAIRAGDHDRLSHCEIRSPAPLASAPRHSSPHLPAEVAPSSEILHSGRVSGNG